MIQEIASFVDPDPTVEFDPASRVSRHASLKCASLLSFFLSFSLFSQPPSLSVQRLFLSARNFSLLFFLFPLRVSLALSLARVRSPSFSFARPKQKKQLDQLGARSEGQARRRRRRREKKEKRISRQRGTEHSRRDKERSGGRGRRTQQEKKEEQREEQQK